MSTVADFLARLAPFAPEIEALVSALETAATGSASAQQQAAIDAVRASMVAAADAAVRKEDGL